MVERIGGIWKQMCGSGFVSGIASSVMTALIIAAILGILGMFNSIPTTYAQKTELKAVEEKHDEAIAYLNNHKMDKTEYYREHEELRAELNKNVTELKGLSKDNRELLIQILREQRKGR